MENFKNKIFSKKEEKFEDFLEHKQEVKRTSKFLSVIKKNPRNSENNSYIIKSGSPVLWLKSQKRTEEKKNLKIFELKELEVPIHSIPKNEAGTQTKYNHEKRFILDIINKENINPIDKVSSKDKEITKIEIIHNLDIKSPPIQNKFNQILQKININEDINVEGNIIKWKYGDKISEGGSSFVYRAFNIQNGSIFVVKKFHSMHDKKMAHCYQVIFKFI